jgi:hypothetical protein
VTVNLETEPVTLMAALNAAIGSTIGILTLTEVISPEVGGAIATALAAWILVGAIVFVRPNVASPLTQKNLAAELEKAKAADEE